MFESVKYVSSGKFVSRGEWVHPDRVIDSYEVIYVLEGCVCLNENGREYELLQGDSLILEPGVRHFGYRHTKNTSFYWLHLTGSPPIPPEIKLQHTAKPYELSVLFSQLLHFSCDSFFHEGLDYLGRLILMELFSTDVRSDGSRLVNEVAAWIRANADVDIKVSEVARHFGYNGDYLNRLFRNTYGHSLKAYIDGAKMDFIKNTLLTSDTSLTKVATMAGFSEYKYFLKYFKYHEGMTPTEFCNTYSKTRMNNK